MLQLLRWGRWNGSGDRGGVWEVLHGVGGKKKEMRAWDGYDDTTPDQLECFRAAKPRTFLLIFIWFLNKIFLATMSLDLMAGIMV